MRHRIINIAIGLGNPEKPLLTNSGTLDKELAKNTHDLYFSAYDGFDYEISEDSVAMGIEPAYQYDRLKIISINKDKNKSYIKTGRAWGMYGSQIASSIKFYENYKTKSKFVKFVDYWHEKLFKGDV